MPKLQKGGFFSNDKWICDTCHKSYGSPVSAKDCEKRHIEYSKKSQSPVTNKYNFRYTSGCKNIIAAEYYLAILEAFDIILEQEEIGSLNRKKFFEKLDEAGIKHNSKIRLPKYNYSASQTAEQIIRDGGLVRETVQTKLREINQSNKVVIARKAEKARAKEERVATEKDEYKAEQIEKAMNLKKEGGIENLEKALEILNDYE